MFTNNANSLSSCLLCLFLLFCSNYSLANAWIIQLDASSSQVRIAQEGTISNLGSQAFSYPATPYQTTTILITPIFPGLCNGNILSWQNLNSIKFEFNSLAPNSNDYQTIHCNSPLSIPASVQSQNIGVYLQINNFSKQDLAYIASHYGENRIQIATVHFTTREKTTSTPLYFELVNTPTNQTSPIKISYSGIGASFKLVGAIIDSRTEAKIVVSKNASAGTQPIRYALSIESLQQKNNQYYLLSNKNEAVPYKIQIGQQEIHPTFKYYAQLPSGSLGTSTLTLHFSLKGSDTQQLDAGTYLADRLTIVVTPTN